MFESTNPFVTSELDYRTERIRRGVAVRPRRRRGLRRGGRSAGTPRTVEG